MDLTQEYYQKKKALLNQCLRLSEDIASGLEQWENLAGILLERESLLDQIKELELETTEETKRSLPHDKRRDLDQSIKLILDFDQDTIKAMRKEQEDIMTSLKANIQEQKTIQYGTSTQPSSGRLMNYGL